MDTKDYIKLAVLVFMFFAIAPALGFIISRKLAWQRIVFGLMCFMTISGFFGPAEWGLTLKFDPYYRGHARGFHFFFNEVLALALILASVFNSKSKTRFFPPGIWLFLIYCGMSMVSIINAPSQLYLWMAALKQFKILLIFVAAYNFFRNEEDVHFFLKVMSYTMLWEMVAVLKMKYMDGVYQVWGTFEHQNPLCMYGSMIGMVLLAAGTSVKHRNANLYMLGFIATAVCVQSSLSRAGLVIFAGGSVGILVLGLLEKITKRRIVTVAILSFIAMVGLAFTMDTIIKRYNDYYNINSNNDRKLLNQASKNMLSDYPLGIGWNNYGLTINKPYKYGEVIDEWYRANKEAIDPNGKKGISESHYWLLLAETGYQGFISFMVFILVFLWWTLRGAWAFRRTFLGAVSLGIAMGFSVNYVQSILERVLTQPRNMMLWLILLAATARIEMWRRAEVKRRKTEVKERKRAVERQPEPRPMAAAH